MLVSPSPYGLVQLAPWRPALGDDEGTADVSYTANEKSTLEARELKHVVEVGLAQSAISHKEHDFVRAPKHDYANMDTVVDAPKEHDLLESATPHDNVAAAIEADAAKLVCVLFACFLEPTQSTREAAGDVGATVALVDLKLLEEARCRTRS